MTSKKNQNNKRNQSYKINYKKKHNNITGPQMKLFDDFVKFVIDIALFLKDNNITFTTNIWGEALGLMIQLVKKLREDKNKKDNNMLKDINVLYVRIGKLLEGIENFVDIYKDYIGDYYSPFKIFLPFPGAAIFLSLAAYKRVSLFLILHRIKFCIHQ